MSQRLIILALLCAYLFPLNAQERLLDLYENPYIENTLSLKSAKADIETHSLPFFEDFNDAFTHPSPKRWLDNYAYINNQYCIGPPSYGVATLDAVDGQGKHYDIANSNPFAADSLTSIFIDMSNADSDSVYLSFYYQPQGYGNYPEKNDSLLLQAKDNNGIWETLWFSEGDNYLNFRKNTLKIPDDYLLDTIEFGFVMLPIAEEKYMHAEFQFRFVNYASIAGAGNPSRATNCDHWHVDYITLDEGRAANDTIFKDLVFIKAPDPYMYFYTSIPWAHYPLIIDNILTTTSLHLRNNGSQKATIAPASLYFIDNNSFWQDSITLGSESIDPYTNLTGFTWAFSTSPIPHDENESADFTIKATINTNQLDNLSNNSISLHQKFENYYAYDDGTAEKVYSHNTNGGSVAYQFTTTVPDILRGVDMYFLRNNPQEEAAESFVLNVWADDNGIPGKLLASESGKKPAFSDKINGFATIKLDSAIYIEGTYYVGWQQTSDKYLNVGFDKNIRNNERIFYNFFGTWDQTEFLGSLMIRPLFGAPLVTSVKEPQELSEFKIYPNPANESIRLQLDNNERLSIIEIYNISGQLINSVNYFGERIDVSNLNNGVYFIKPKSATQQYKAQRLIIAR